MRPIRSLVFLFATILLCAGVALAEDEIVHFTNGTSMAVHGHSIEGGMVKVDLGDDAVMAFPLVMVEKITKAGREIALDERGPSNRAIAGSSSGGSGGASGGGSTYVLSAADQVPSRYRRGRGGGEGIDEQTMEKLNRALGIEESGNVSTPVYRPRGTNPKLRSMTGIQNPLLTQPQTQVRSPLTRMPNGRQVMMPSDTGMSAANPNGTSSRRAGATRIRLDDDVAVRAAAEGATAAAGDKTPPPPPPADGGSSTQGGGSE